MKFGGSTAWRSITQPISDRSLSDALVGLPYPAREIHRASSSCLQASQRQIALRGEANWTSPSKRICPTPTWNGVRLARCFARGSIRQPTPASAPRTVPQPVSSRSQIDLRPRPGSLPFSGANASCGCLPPQRCRYSNRVLVQCPGASPEDYFPARCFSQAQAEARVSSIGRSAFQPSSFSARVGSAQMATTSPGRRGANL